MKPQKRLGFVIPVLLIAGILYSAWAYYTRGLSGLRSRSAVWLLALGAALLTDLLVRRLEENANHYASDRRRWLDPGRIVWMEFAAGAVATAFVFGLGKNTAAALVALVTVLLTIIYAGFAIRHGKTDKSATK